MEELREQNRLLELKAEKQRKINELMSDIENELSSISWHTSVVVETERRIKQHYENLEKLYEQLHTLQERHLDR